MLQTKLIEFTRDLMRFKPVATIKVGKREVKVEADKVQPGKIMIIVLRT